MACATWIRNELDQRGIAYEELHHSEAFTAQGCQTPGYPVLQLHGYRRARTVLRFSQERITEMTWCGIEQFLCHDRQNIA